MRSLYRARGRFEDAQKSEKSDGDRLALLSYIAESSLLIMVLPLGQDQKRAVTVGTSVGAIPAASEK